MPETPAISFTAAQLAECDDEHGTPVLGCPVCLLYLLYAQDMVQLGAETAELVAATGNQAARDLLAEFRGMRDTMLRRHLERPPVRWAS
jgi:hypothetical protein